MAIMSLTSLYRVDLIAFAFCVDLGFVALVLAQNPTLTYTDQKVITGLSGKPQTPGKAVLEQQKKKDTRSRKLIANGVGTYVSRPTQNIFLLPAQFDWYFEPSSLIDVSLLPSATDMFAMTLFIF